MKQLDAFAKQYNCNARLGEDFLRSVIEVTLHPEKSMGRVRQACLATNLTSPKIVDGIARLLTSNDLLRLKKHPDLLTFEGDLEHAFAVRDRLPSSLSMLFGRFQIRCVGFLVGKSKNTIEAKEYKRLPNWVYLLSPRLRPVRDIDFQRYFVT